MSAKFSAKKILPYVFYALCALLCGGAAEGSLCFGLFVGATYCINAPVAALIAALSSLPFGWRQAAHSAVRCGVYLVFFFLHKILGKRINKAYMLLYTSLSCVFYCVYGTEDYFALFDKLLYSCCGIAFSYVSLYLFRALFSRGIRYSPASEEVICIAIFAVVISYAASCLTLWEFNVGFFLFPFVLLFASALSAKGALVCAALLGLGNLLATGAYDGCVFCLFAALSAVTFFRLNKYVAGLSVVIADVLMSYFMGLHGQFSTLVFAPTVCSVAAFFLLPKRCTDYVRDCLCADKNLYLGKSVAKKAGAVTSAKLYRLADVFSDMKNAFFALSAPTPTNGDGARAVTNACKTNVCGECREKSRCGGFESVVTQIAMNAVEKGRCTILDVPQNTSFRCARITALLAEINVQSRNWREYADRVNRENEGKKLLGTQLKGVSALLDRLAVECRSEICCDEEKQKELFERLNFHNLLCRGAAVLNMGDAVVTVSSDCDKDAVCRVAEGVMGIKLTARVESTESPSWINVLLSPAPRYAVTFGVSSLPKRGSEVSGDTHTVINTDNGKCIVALCDGMGSGSRAEKYSETAMALVESLYRAGLDSDTVLSAVNTLLTEGGNEVFCATDILVIDLSTACADMIKLGSPQSFVKTSDGVKTVSGSSLPLGVLEEMTPHTCRMQLEEGGVALLASDGVTDSLAPCDIADLLAETMLTNPQSIAEAVLNKALRGGAARDDMTVVAVRLTDNAPSGVTKNAEKRRDKAQKQAV